MLRIFLTPKSKALQPKLSAARDRTNQDLLKPFSLETLQKTVKKVCGSDAGLKPNRYQQPEGVCGWKTKQIVTQDPWMLRILDMARQVADSRPLAGSTSM